jgi:hypothetical protein
MRARRLLALWVGMSMGECQVMQKLTEAAGSAQ